MFSVHWWVMRCFQNPILKMFMLKVSSHEEKRRSNFFSRYLVHNLKYKSMYLTLIMIYIGLGKSCLRIALHFTMVGDILVGGVVDKVGDVLEVLGPNRKPNGPWTDWAIICSIFIFFVWLRANSIVFISIFFPWITMDKNILNYIFQSQRIFLFSDIFVTTCDN